MRYKAICIGALLFLTGCESWFISPETLNTIKETNKEAKAIRDDIAKKEQSIKTEEKKAISKGIALTEAARYANTSNPDGLPKETVNLTIDTALESFAITGIVASYEDKAKALELANAKLKGDNAAVSRILDDIRKELTDTKNQLTLITSERDLLIGKYNDVNNRFNEQIAKAEANANAKLEKYKLEKEAELAKMQKESEIKIAQAAQEAKNANELLNKKNTGDVCKLIALGLGGLLVALMVAQFAFHVPVNAAAYGYIAAGIAGVMGIPYVLGTIYFPILGTVVGLVVVGGLLYEMVRTQRKVKDTKVTEHSFDEMLPGIIKAIEKLPTDSSGMLISTLSETLGNTAKGFICAELVKLGKNVPEGLKPIDKAK